MFRLKCFVFLLLFSVNKVDAQKAIVLKSHSDTIKQLYTLVNNDQLLSTSSISLGEPSKPFYRFYYLLSLIKPNELVQMTNDTSRYLRIYGYIGLLHKRHQTAKDVEQSLLQDTAIIRTMSGCILRQMSISDAVRQIERWYEKDFFAIIAKKYVTRNQVFNFSKKELLAK
jgi:hypothetical protein